MNTKEKKGMIMTIQKTNKLQVLTLLSIERDQIAEFAMLGYGVEKALPPKKLGTMPKRPRIVFHIDTNR
jgi:hypothetical protein